MSQIKKSIEEKRAVIFRTILSGLVRIGEQFVINARNTNTYKDQTGNLRSSIGYVIYYNGTQQQQNFEGSTEEGVIKGTELADAVAADHPTGFVIICVAGMNYAAAVESKGFDVISNSSITALADIRTMVKRLQEKVKKL